MEVILVVPGFNNGAYGDSTFHPRPFPYHPFPTSIFPSCQLLITTAVGVLGWCTAMMGRERNGGRGRKEG
jgi:hypothetical protein